MPSEVEASPQWWDSSSSLGMPLAGPRTPDYFTVIVAVALFVAPHELLTRTQYCVVAVSRGVVYVALFVPTGVDVLPLAPRNHWYVTGRGLEATTLSVAVAFLLMVWLCGWVVIDGAGSTVITADPLPLPVQYASETDVTVYVVVVDGDTVRVPVEVTAPSDQVTLNGAVPVSVAVMVVAEPAQMVALPETTAVGAGRGVTVTEELGTPLQFASVIVSR